MSKAAGIWLARPNPGGSPSLAIFCLLFSEGCSLIGDADAMTLPPDGRPAPEATKGTTFEQH